MGDYCHSAGTGQKFPGFLVLKSSQCYSNVTDSHGYCVGVKLGGPCSSFLPNLLCDIGLFCDSTHVCQQLRDLRESCSTDALCQPNLFCDEKTQKCRQLATKFEGDSATSALMCASGYVYKGKCARLHELTSKQYLTTNESIEGACKYSDGITEDAVCIRYSDSPNTTAHCRQHGQIYGSRFAAFKRYVIGYRRNSCTAGQLFCDRAVAVHGTCEARKALEAIYPNELADEKFMPVSCWRRPVEEYLNRYKC